MREKQSLSDDIEKIREKVINNGPKLVINRIPEKTLDGFKKLATSEFCDDYGMTLKFLFDAYSNGRDEIEERVADLEYEVENLKMRSAKKTINLLGGDSIEVKSDE